MPMSITGTITTPTGGRVVCHRNPDGSWDWTCVACGKCGSGSEREVRDAGAHHLSTRVLCAFQSRR